MKFIAAAALVLVVSAYAVPVIEESWSAEDDLLARVYSDSAPVSTLLQSEPTKSASGDLAEEKQKAAEEAAAEAKEHEEEWAAKEPKRHNKVLALREESKTLADDAAKANAKADADAAAYDEQVMKSVTDAAAMTAKAEKAKEASDAEYAR